MTYEEARDLFEYDPGVGLRFKGGAPVPWRGIGKDCRYLALNYKGKKHYAHRLVWLYHHGELPPMIDHIDGDFRNNLIENLRPCTPAQNQYNSKRKVHNQSGYKGVAFCKGYRNPWRARIIVDKKVVELGRYSTPEEAAAAYAEGARKYAKQFARID